MIALERLKELVSYDRETGRFHWNIDRGGLIMAGHRAGYTRKDGYLVLVLDGESYLGHRVAWFYETGSWPDEMIDHINGNPADNRLANLREATRSQNMMNMAVPPANTSGFKGVSFCKRSNRWDTYITVDRKRRRLGYFQNIEDAVAARKAAEASMFGQFARAEIERLGSMGRRVDSARVGE